MRRCTRCGQPTSLWKRDLFSGQCRKCQALQEQKRNHQAAIEERQGRGRLLACVYFLLGLMILLLTAVFGLFGWLLAGSDEGMPGIPKDSSLAVGFLAILLGIILYIPGVRLINKSRRMRAVPATVLLSSDKRRPVLYLRSFQDDSVTSREPFNTLSGFHIWFPMRTEEEQLSEVFSQFGPFVAIGRPGEALPELGASRLYVSNEEWQETVAALMTRAKLVVFRASDTQGLLWEIRQAAQSLPPDQLIFVIPNDIDYERFRLQAEEFLPCLFPELCEKGCRCGSLAGIIYFTNSWTPYLLAPEGAVFSRPRLGWFFKPMVPVLQMTLAPIFGRLGVPWAPPPRIRWGGCAVYLGVLLVPPLILLIFSIWMTTK